ncbi:MAG TPA: GIY-YIG nuclease family protein [Patescibacteria group bacterium]|nr:GIY-YIG nuclease family protein [Patescibacteria group bacterium]
MYFVYIIESINYKKLYIGYTPTDVNKRLDKHNLGLVQSTKAFRPWEVIYYEAYLNRKDATGRERFLKSGSGRKFINKQLTNYFGLPRGEQSELYAGR